MNDKSRPCDSADQPCRTLDAVERWLNDAVSPAYDAALEFPGASVPADQVFRRIRELHHDRLAKRHISDD